MLYTHIHLIITFMHSTLIQRITTDALIAIQQTVFTHLYLSSKLFLFLFLCDVAANVCPQFLHTLSLFQQWAVQDTTQIQIMWHHTNRHVDDLPFRDSSMFSYTDLSWFLSSFLSDITSCIWVLNKVTSCAASVVTFWYSKWLKIRSNIYIYITYTITMNQRVKSYKKEKCRRGR